MNPSEGEVGARARSPRSISESQGWNGEYSGHSWEVIEMGEEERLGEAVGEGKRLP